MATNRSHACTSRLSKVTPVASNGSLAEPPVAAAISSQGQRGVTEVPPCERSSWGGETCGAWWRGRRRARQLPLQHFLCGKWFPSPSADREELRSRGPSCRALARNQCVVERQDLVADDLPRLVTLAGDQHDVAFARDADGFGDGFAAAG